MTTYFLNHFIGSIADGFHGQGREQEGNHRSQNDTGKGQRIEQINDFQLYDLGIRSEQRQGCEGGRAYGEAFGKDPQFAEFYRSLDAYKASIGKKGDVLVIDPASSDFFKNMRGAPTRR